MQNPDEQLWKSCAELQKGLQELYGIEFHSLYLHGTALKESTKIDIDTVAIIENNVCKIDFAKKTSHLLILISKKYNKFLCCFPIHASQFDKQSSQFIRNIHIHGKKIVS